MKKYYIQQLEPNQIEELTKRPAVDFESVFGVVRKVLEDIKINGD